MLSWPDQAANQYNSPLVSGPSCCHSGALKYIKIRWSHFLHLNYQSRRVSGGPSTTPCCSSSLGVNFQRHGDHVPELQVSGILVADELFQNDMEEERGFAHYPLL